MTKPKKKEVDTRSTTRAWKVLGSTYVFIIFMFTVMLGIVMAAVYLSEQYGIDLINMVLT